jgi:signal peptidase II
MKMKIKTTVRIVTILVLLATNIGCDQVSKSIVRRHLAYDERIKIIDDCVTLTRIENSGSFLSLGDSLTNPMRFILLTLFPLLFLAVGVAALFIKTNLTLVNVLGFSFVLGGGIGNIYDRIVHGSVTDFIHIDFGLFQTGVFNMADVSIMTGIVVLFIHSYVRQAREIRIRQ